MLCCKKKVEQTSTSKIKVGSEGEFVNPSQKRYLHIMIKILIV